jgi:exodeoxyribonuclease VII large subunit
LTELPLTPPPVAELPAGKGLGNLPILTVSELSFALKRTVEEAYARVRVRGEISSFKRAASGHLYLCLKDTDAVIDGVVWRATAGGLGIRPEDGMEVIATGRLTTYPGRSRYQIVIDSLELAGQGALLKLIEERRKRLEAEGLFDAARKRPLPFLPTVIGVVTSPTGAVIRDILHRLADRFPRHVLIWPVLVQGEGAAQQIAAAIAGFNRLTPDGAVPRPDLLIVARGGGSLEDLMCFNEEIVVRAAAASLIPLISAVGHETDTTLIDFASDRRAPTPTAAAEMAVPVRAELLSRSLECGARLVQAYDRLLSDGRDRLAALARVMGDPRRLMEDFTQRLDDRWERLRLAGAGMFSRYRTELAHAGSALRPQRLTAMVEDRQDRVRDLGKRLDGTYARTVEDGARRYEHVCQLLESYSYKNILKRGYVLVTDKSGNLVESAAEAKPGDAVDLRFHDGNRGAVIEGDGVARPSQAAPAQNTQVVRTPKRDSGPRGSSGNQGSLL